MPGQNIIGQIIRISLWVQAQDHRLRTKQGRRGRVLLDIVPGVHEKHHETVKTVNTARAQPTTSGIDRQAGLRAREADQSWRALRQQICGAQIVTNKAGWTYPWCGHSRIGAVIPPWA